MKRILQIVNYFYPHIGGIEKVARDIAETLAVDGQYEQKIICFNEDAVAGTHVCRRRKTCCDMIDGVDVIRCGCFGKVASQSISLSFGRELKKIMNEFSPDIVIFHYPNPFEASFLMQYLKRDFRFILYWHLDIVKQRLLKKLFHWQTIRLLRRADDIIATSPPYIDGSPYLRQYKSKCRVIPNCISEAQMVVTESVRQKAASIRSECAGKIICFSVGRHVPYKGFEYLVKASRFLDDRFRIFIGGEGEQTASLKKTARHDYKIIFLGRLSQEDLIAYYIAMDIFCFPSITKNEAFGIALAEGMYWGKPTVTFHIPGSGVNYVSPAGECGMEVANRDIESYADALSVLADHPELRERMGRASRARVLENFLETSFRTRILEFLSTLRGHKTA